MSKSSIADRHRPRPRDRPRIERQLIPMKQMIVGKRGEEIVAGGNRIGIARQVEIDIVHGLKLGLSSAGTASLDPKDRSKRRLSKRHHSSLTHVTKSHRQSDRRGRLPFAQRGRIDGCYQHISSTRRTRLLLRDL